MTTILHVAKRAGVAPITVSRVINNSGYVTQPIRDRVALAVAELGYVPNNLARSLRSRRTQTLALVLTDVTNPFFTTVARGVEDAASAAGFMVILGNTDEQSAKEREYLQMLLQRRVDGILLVPALDAHEAIKTIERQNIPLILLDRGVRDASVDIVRCDSGGGAYQLGRLLASLGHKSFAIVTGPEGVTTSDDRVEGFQRALTDAGVPARSQIHHGKFSSDSGYEMTRHVLSTHPRPTAIFAANNVLAIGALNALHDLGVRVPEEIALVGFDDLPPALVTFPFLTVASQPAYEMGQRAVALLLDRLNDKTPSGPQEIVLPSELIIRRSSGNARE